jgi:hypothetical protein
VSAYAKEPGIDPNPVGAEHQRRSDTATVCDPTCGDDRQRRDRVDDGRNERQRRDPAGMTGLRALGRHDIDAGSRSASSAVDRAHLAHHDRPDPVCGFNERGRVREGMGNDPVSFVERDSHQLRGARKMTDEPHSERTIRQLTRATNLSNQHSGPPIVVPPISPRPPAADTAAASCGGKTRVFPAAAVL